jgi:glucosyl-dolichyl phosphate glucuronosyltransferase
MQPVASIIVPTCNRAASLARTLQSLCAQRVQADYQILVVDNGPTDETRRVAQEAIAAHPQQMIHYIQEPIPGLLSGRHRGALEAKSDLLIFVDDDIEPEPGWLAAFLDSFRDPTVQLVGGPSLPSYEGQPPDWLGKFWIETPSGGKICTWLSLIDLGDREMVVDPTFVLGLNLGIRRSALLAAGGFHPDCIPDHLLHWQGDGETGLALKLRKLGFLAVYQPRALVRHRISPSRLSVEHFERRGYYQGVCDSYTKIRATAFAPAASASKKNFYAAEQKRAEVARERRRWRQGMFDPAQLVVVINVVGNDLDERALTSRLLHGAARDYVNFGILRSMPSECRDGIDVSGLSTWG